MFKEIQKCKTEFYKFDVDSSSEEYELNDKIYSKALEINIAYMILNFLDLFHLVRIILVHNM